MADFKIIGSEDAPVSSVGLMTQGIGFPLRPVEPSGAGQPLIVGVENVLTATSLDTQTVSTSDAPIQLTLGPAQTPANGLVSLDAAGTLTFLEDITATLRIRLQIGRTTGQGEALVVFRALINDTQTAPPVPAQIDDSDVSLPLTFEDTASLPAGTTLKFEIYRDSNGAPQGSAGIFSYPTTLWGQTASARLTITRAVSTEAAGLQTFGDF